LVALLLSTISALKRANHITGILIIENKLEKQPNSNILTAINPSFSLMLEVFE